MERHDPRAVRRARRIARLSGALVGIVGGVLYCLYLIQSTPEIFQGRVGLAATALGAVGLAGLALGTAIGPSVTVDPYLWIEGSLASASGSELVGGVLGLVVGLVVAALLAVPLMRLPDGIGVAISLSLTAVLVYLGVTAGVRRRADLASLLGHIGAGRSSDAAGIDTAPAAAVGSPAVVDTSVLIDGRILDVARSGFLPGRLLIPGFVLEELQRIADAGDPLRRAKGRRGLATVEGLQKLSDPRCEVIDVDFPGVVEVDSRLLRLTRARGAALMTTDYMLNRLAQIEGMRVLNLNDLALALKPIVSAGETMDIAIVKEGKELHQGVGYLDDGTMVVVENGSRHIDRTVTATVTSVIQTPAGRMIFALVPPPQAASAAAGGGVRGRSARPPAPRLPRVVKS